MGPQEELEVALPSLDAWDGRDPQALEAFVHAAERYVREVDPRSVDTAATLSLFGRATAAGSRAVAKVIGDVRDERDPATRERTKAHGRRLQEVVTLLANAAANRLKSHS